MCIDSVLRDIGAYQWSIMILYGVTCLLVGMSNVGILLIAPKLDHWCSDPSESFQNLTPSEQRMLMSKAGTCRRPDMDFSLYTGDELLAMMNTSVFNNSRKCDTGLVFNHQSFDYTATEQYNLGCDRAWLISLASTLYMLGYFVAALTSGALSDRYGRRTVLIWSISLMCVCHMMAAFSPWLPMFLVARFLVGMFDIATYTSGLILAVEFVRRDQRKYPEAFSAGCFALGGVLLATISYGVKSHIYLQVTMSVACFPLALISWWWVEESPRWLASQHRRSEAYAVVETVANYNRQQIAHLEHLHVATEMADGRKRRRTNFLDLLRTPLIRKRTLVLSALWFTLVLVYYALLFSLGDFGENIRVNMIISGLLEFPSVALAVATIDLFGRQSTMFTFRMFSGICCLCMMFFVGDKNSPFLLMFAAIGKLFTATEFFIIYVYSQELYPTVIRNMGLGSASTVSRVAGMIAPQIAMLNVFWPPLQVVILGSVAIIGGLLIPMLPETSHSELMQSIDDGENFHPHHRYHISCTIKRIRSRSNSTKSDIEPDKGNIQEPLNETSTA